jgi:hypothetical protein
MNDHNHNVNRIYNMNNYNNNNDNPRAEDQNNAAEEVGVAAAVARVRRVFTPLYGQLPVNLERFLTGAVRHIFHIMDADRDIGIILENAVLREQGIIDTARTTYNLVERDMPNNIVRQFENLEFHERLIYINLVIFLYNYVIQIHHQNEHPGQLNRNN